MSNLYDLWTDELLLGDIIVVKEARDIAAAGNNKPLSAILHGFGDFNQNDRMELWVKIDGGTGNVTVKEGGVVSVEERAS